MSQKRRSAADEPHLTVRSSASDLAPGQVIGEHAHGWHQLIHASAGVLMVSTGAGSWVVPSRWGVWVPAEVPHRIRAAAPSAFRTVYLAPGCFAGLPEACAAIAVSPLMRELILRTVALGMLDRRDRVEGAIGLVLADEIARAPAPPFGLPEPRTEATRRAVERLFMGEGEAGLAAVARDSGMSLRTLERRFIAETGTSLGRWRRRGAMRFGRAAGGRRERQAGRGGGGLCDPERLCRGVQGGVRRDAGALSGALG